MFHFKRFVLTWTLGLLFFGAVNAMARGNDVELQGLVNSVTNTATTRTFTLHVMGFNVPVQITSDTQFELDADEVGLAGIHVGDFVKVSGYFSNAAIIAEEIALLDRGSGEFRLRGQITAARNSADGRILTLLGVEVLVTSDTRIERRGPEGGFTLADLVAGFFVDTRGTHSEGNLVATRLHVGNRGDEPIRVEFAGTVKVVGTNRLTVDTEGGSDAVVLTSASTEIIGTPVVNSFVEVRGTLNERLEVVADRIRVKTSRDADDEEREERGRVNNGNDGNRNDRGRPGETDGDEVQYRREVRIVAVGAGTVHGSAELEFKQEGSMITQEFKVTLERAGASAEYRIQVNAGTGITLDFGTLRTNAEGRATREFTAVPGGKTVRDFTGIQILNAAGTVVAQGTL